MNRLLVTATVLAALGAVPAGASAPVGLACAANVADDHGHEVGEVDGGPFTAADPSVRRIVLTCAIQSGGTGLASDPDVLALSASGAVVAYLRPTPVDFTVGPGPLYVCTTLAITYADGTTTRHYYDAGNGFVGDAGAAHCAPFAEAGA